MAQTDRPTGDRTAGLDHSGQSNDRHRPWESDLMGLGLIIMKDLSPLQSRKERDRRSDELAPARGAVLGALFGVCVWAVSLACSKCFS
jgi:hypothetical protein